MRTALRKARYACAAALALSLAGCAHAHPAGTAGGPRRAGTVALSRQAVDLVTRAGQYYADGAVLGRATDRLTGTCMVSHGLRYAVEATPPSRDEDWRPDPAERRRDGYGLREKLSTQPPAFDRYVRALPSAQQERYELTLYGSQDTRSSITLQNGSQAMFATRGCTADAWTALYGSPSTAARVLYEPQVAYISLYLRARADSRYAAAMRRWSACMARGGYRYSSPDDARQRLVNEYRTSGPATARRHEIAVAVADAACTERVRLPSLVESLLRHYAEGLPGQARAALDTVAAVRAASARTARRVVGGG